MSCQQISVDYRERERQRKRERRRQASEAQRQKEREELDNRGETSLTSNVKQSKKEIEKEGAKTVLTSNGK